MTLEELIVQLEFRYPQLKRAFGSINIFVENLYYIYLNKTLDYLTELINFKERLVVLNPVQSRFTLYDNYDLVDKESVIFEQPYSVYDIEYNLLYSVSSHYGIFGNSILDGLLNIDYKPGSLFYLDYYTYKGRKQIILVNGLLPSSISKPIEVNNYSPSTLLQGNKYNQIAITFISGNRDMKREGLPYYPLRVYYLPTSSTILLSKEAVINSALTQKTDYVVDYMSKILLNPKESGWLVFSQVTSTEEVELGLSNIEGRGIDRLIEVAKGFYYIGIDADINLSLFRQSFNLDNVVLPEFDNYKGMNIEANISLLT